MLRLATLLLLLLMLLPVDKAESVVMVARLNIFFSLHAHQLADSA